MIPRQGAKVSRSVLTSTTGLGVIFLLAIGIGLHSENVVRYGHITNGNISLDVAFPPDGLSYDKIEITIRAEDEKNGLDRLLVKDETRDLVWGEMGLRTKINKTYPLIELFRRVPASSSDIKLTIVVRNTKGEELSLSMTVKHKLP